MKFKSKIYLNISILGIIVFLILFLFDFPLLSSLKKSAQTIQATKKSFSLLTERYQNFEKFQEDYKKNQPTLQKANSLLVNQAAPIHFIEFLEQQAKITGVNLKISKIVPSEPKTALSGHIKFSLYLNGSFPLCLRFLRKLELSPYLVAIQDIKVRRSAEEKIGEGAFPKDVIFVVNIVVRSK